MLLATTIDRHRHSPTVTSSVSLSCHREILEGVTIKEISINKERTGE